MVSVRIGSSSHLATSRSHNTSCYIGYCCPALVMPAVGPATETPGIWGGGSVVAADPVPGPDLEAKAVQGYEAVEEVKTAPESEANLESKEGLESAANLESKEGLESGVEGFWAGRESEVAGFWAGRGSEANLELKEGLESGVVGFWAGRGSEAMVAAELILIGPAGRYMLPIARQ
uniref:Uncharacterized protein n=1 Tax=Salix viminalis TaxID=40686 RepID=A0A6N2MDW5_SALVM